MKETKKSSSVTILLALSAAVTGSGPALAQTCQADFVCPELPGPGVFPLIALGIAGAIALAKLRK